MVVIIAVDILLSKCWIAYINPDPSVSIYLIGVLPFIFIVNLIISGAMYIMKKKYAVYFLINSFVSVIIMYLLFGWATEQNVKKTMEIWNVSINDIKYEIIRNKQDNTFYTSIDLGNGAFRGIEKDQGIVYLRSDTLFFQTIDSIQYFIHDNFIFNFKGTKKEEIKKKL